MKYVVTEKLLPINSIILNSFGKTDYIDIYKIHLKIADELTVDYLTVKFFATGAKWAEFLLGLRNSIVKVFGLKTGMPDATSEIQKSVHFLPGQKAAIFTVHSRSNDEIVMAEKDKHLNFRVSILMNRDAKKESADFYCITAVQYNNLFGRLYFTIVKPFHRLIVKTSLANMALKFSSK